MLGSGGASEEGEQGWLGESAAGARCTRQAVKEKYGSGSHEAVQSDTECKVFLLRWLLQRRAEQSRSGCRGTPRGGASLAQA